MQVFTQTRAMLLVGTKMSRQDLVRIRNKHLWTLINLNYGSEYNFHLISLIMLEN
jgi:hypothetical protein